MDPKNPKKPKQPKPTKLIADKVADCVASRMDDVFDGYIVLGFVAGTGDGVKIVKAMDQKTARALRALLQEFIAENSPS